LVAAEKVVETNLRKLEALKPRINKRYDRYTQVMRDRQSRKLSTEVSFTTEPRDRVIDPALTGVAKPLEAGENRDLAVRLAQSEFTRRATVRRTQEQGDDDSRRAAGVWGNWEDALKTDDRGGDDLSQRIQNIRTNIGPAQPMAKVARQKPTAPDIPPRVSSAYKYPTVPRQNALDPFVPQAQIAIYDKNAERQPPPVLPPKEHIAPSRASFVDGASAEPPALPAKVSSPPPPPGKSPLPEAPSTGSNLDPASYTFKPSAYLENGSPLRSVFLPANLRTQFLSAVAANTQRNLETCGILCGTLVSNALFISKLLIPEQTATSDTCETTNESAIFEFCDSEDLLMLGWIHTHPSQTCFMSSRDLHTHCGYQVMLAESIAIVCAPSKTPDWGVFRLTDPPGLKTVLNCTQSGLFHPHAEDNIYTGALRPGHVFEVNGLEFETVDLRPNN
jgi:STAM-binding protein